MIFFDLTDEMLVSLTILGNNLAFEELVLRYRKAVTVSVCSIIKNTSLAEDVIQDSFITAWTKLNTLKDAKKFGAWICSIARNQAKNLAVKYRGHINYDLLKNTLLEPGEIFDNIFFAEENEPLHTMLRKFSQNIMCITQMQFLPCAWKSLLKALTKVIYVRLRPEKACLLMTAKYFFTNSPVIQKGIWAIPFPACCTMLPDATAYYSTAI